MEPQLVKIQSYYVTGRHAMMSSYPRIRFPPNIPSPYNRTQQYTPPTRTSKTTEIEGDPYHAAKCKGALHRMKPRLRKVSVYLHSALITCYRPVCQIRVRV